MSLQMTERTWKNTEWPELALTTPEGDGVCKVDAVTVGNVLGTIILVEMEFPNDHDKQAARFCGVLQRGCRGVATDIRARRSLYERARRKFALFGGRQATAGYLWTRRQLKKKLAKKGVDITTNYDHDDFYLINAEG